MTATDPADGTATVGAILLAAGESRRFEAGNKLLAEIDGIPIVRHAAETLLATGLDGPVVILGYEAAAVRDALEGTKTAALDFRVNEDYAAGQSTSVAAGVAAARARDWDAAVFALGDMPAVDPASVERVVTAYREGAGTVVAPAHEGVRGNPVLFDSHHFDALASVSGDRGGRELVESEGTLVEVDDPGVRRDVDRVGDLDSDADLDAVQDPDN
jgi:molybdenum cofactor cytidylyltransferase